MRKFLVVVGIWCCVGYWCGSARPEQPAPPAVPAQPAPAQAHGVRVAAEWEPVVGVLIGWPLRIPPALVVAMAKEVDLYVTVSGARNQERAAKQLGEWGIGRDRVHFVVTEQGSGYYLPRDWGPFAVFDERGDYRLKESRFIDYPLGMVRSRRLIWFHRKVGFNYGRDDRAPGALAEALGYPCSEVPLFLTGGNVAFDGQGTAFATQIMLDENRANGISPERFFCVARRELGVRQFHVLPNFACLGIQHVDCLLKLLDEERILVKRVPSDHPSCKHVEQVVRHLSRLTNVHGRPYQILRIDTPRYLLHKTANYTNALIVNRCVFVPLFGIPDADAAALKTWRAAMPGYDVQGFEYARWGFTDALHCRVRGVWDPKMLHLTHRRLDAVVPWAEKVTLAVRVRDHSGQGLVADQMELVWRIRGCHEWRKVRLHPAGQPDLYSGVVEGIPPGQTAEYYFTAASLSGRHETLPRTAPRGLYTLTTAYAGVHP